MAEQVNPQDADPRSTSLFAATAAGTDSSPRRRGLKPEEQDAIDSLPQ